MFCVINRHETSVHYCLVSLMCQKHSYVKNYMYKLCRHVLIEGSLLNSNLVVLYMAELVALGV